MSHLLQLSHPRSVSAAGSRKLPLNCLYVKVTAHHKSIRVKKFWVCLRTKQMYVMVLFLPWRGSHKHTYEEFTWL